MGKVKYKRINKILGEERGSWWLLFMFRLGGLVKKKLEFF